ncbi:protocadherin gamma-C5-like isoform X3 [Ambystoma mexicanum]|uniref:protocadherin gamma-C5-like isoform X3 n=1 Tax=Ambystoma mexicanum TaxID=8296 RepID=UPI0037E72E36
MVSTEGGSTSEEMAPRSSLQAWRWQALCFLCLWGWGSGQLRFSVLEEAEPGTVVGNVARDLGLDAAALSERRLRLSTESNRQHFALDVGSANIVVSEKIDRERLCGSSPSCVLSGEVVIELPLELYRLEVEILDVNDNTPHFPTAGRAVRIYESAAPGSRFPLESAQDPDAGSNAVSGYSLTANPHFSLNVKRLTEGKLFPELVLEKALDRESHEEHQLLLTAFDGGSPARSGTASITVLVLDINDNAPLFDQPAYKVQLREDAPAGTVLVQLNATDSDGGLNGELEYSYEEHTSDPVRRLFLLEPHTGLIRLEGALDFEESDVYEMHVRARDRGVPEMDGRCVVHVDVEDVNDNAPELLLTSLAASVPENTPVGTAVGVFRVRDRDSGKNGQVHLEITPPSFKIKSLGNHYSLVTGEALDRESLSQYTIELLVTDLGVPPLRTQKTIVLNISDVNDNPPRFAHRSITAHIKENNEPGALLCTVTASDPDQGENSRITYSIAERHIEGSPASSYIYISSNNGNIFAQRSFDYELLQIVQITVVAEDAGSPKLSSNVTVVLYILDQNDNAPVVLYPKPSSELTVDQAIRQAFPVGYLVSKVTAVDADSGHNAWLSYSLLQCTDPSLFRISPYSGELRAARGFQERDNLTQRLLIMVKDNGEPPLSTTVTLLLSLEDHIREESPKSGDFQKNPKHKSDMTLYLIISLVAVSILALVTFIALSAKCVFKNHVTSPCCCPEKPKSRELAKQHHPTLTLNPDGTLRFVDMGSRLGDPQDHCYGTYLPPESDKSEFTFMRPLNFPELRDLVNDTDSFVSDVNGINEPSQQAQPFQQSQPFQQAPPNTDWRFSQAQRPGTSGSQNSEEAGGWPNNQFETERLQAMILASANEGADGSSTLGGGAGTMGLSTRYGPQFTLQHVPDYRQNVYIPGSTATLTNAAGKRDGKSAAASGGNKKKSGKKEKK